MAAGDDGVRPENGEQELDRRTHEQEHDDVGRWFGVWGVHHLLINFDLGALGVRGLVTRGLSPSRFDGLVPQRFRSTCLATKHWRRPSYHLSLPINPTSEL